MASRLYPRTCREAHSPRREHKRSLNRCTMVHGEDRRPSPEVPDTDGVVVGTGENQVTAGGTWQDPADIVLE